MRKLRLVLLLIIGVLSTAAVFAWLSRGVWFDSESARDIAINHVLLKHDALKGLEIPSSWETRSLVADPAIPGLDAWQYIGDAWTVNVTYPVVPNPTYTVEIEYTGEISFHWKGTVDQARTVDEKDFSATIDDRTMAWGRQGDLELTMALDRTVISTGEEIEFVFNLTNKGSKTVTFWMGPPFFDVHLYDSDNALTAKWTEGRGFPEYIKQITLEPEETLSETIQWNLYSYNHETGAFIPVKPGRYSISGVWPGETQIETTRISVTVN